MKILFQGDSVTDAGRDRNDPHDMGNGYPKFASAMLTDAYDDVDFEFVNLGISGNRTSDLLARIKADVVDVQPDVLIMMIGVNDVWHSQGFAKEVSAEDVERNLRDILTTIREKTNAKLLMIEPFMLYGSDKEFMFPAMDECIRIERRLAHEFADAYLPMHALFAAATVEQPFTDFSPDGVHPNADGACLIAQHILHAIEPILSSLTAKD